MANIFGNNLKNRLNGTSGNDIFAGMGGDDTINGGKGTDTSYYSGNLAGYQFSTAAGQLVVRDTVATDGDDGADTLINIEKLAFANAGITIKSGAFRVNSTTTGVQKVGDFTELVNGNLISVWVSPHGDAPAVYANMYDSFGNLLKEELSVSSTSAKVSSPTLCALNDGGYVVVWTASDSISNPNNTNIMLQRYDAYGNKVGLETTVNSYKTNIQQTPVVKALNDGGFIVSWESIDSDKYSVYYQSFNADGSRIDFDDKLVVFIPDGSQRNNDTAILTNGNVVISYESARNGQNEIFARIFEPDGTSIKSSFQVNTTTSGIQTSSSIAALNNGGFVAVWASTHNSDFYSTYGQLFDEGGNKIGAEFAVSTGNVSIPLDVTTLANGNFVVAFESLAGLFLQRFDESGNRIGVEIEVNDFTNNQAKLTSLSDGGFIVTWNSVGTDDKDQGVYGQLFDANGNSVGITVTGTNAGDVLNVGNQTYLTVDGANGNDSITGGAGDDNLRGGLDKDTLIGGLGDDRLDGGDGADSMNGGQGSDIYVVDSTGDVITETGTIGSDTVESSINYTLGATLENLTLTGIGNINGTGNSLGNVLIGNAGNNILDGKAGADLMAGGLGNDTYIIDSMFDLVAENLNAGTDTIMLMSDFYILGDNLENLTIATTAPSNTYVEGNALNNVIVGNTKDNEIKGEGGKDNLRGEAGNDRISGGDDNDLLVGGLGKDTLTGGDGNDTFRFDTALGSDNADVIQDFVSTKDIINLDDSIFSGAGFAGILAESEFALTEIAPNAKASQHIIYRFTTGELFYNADGAGSGAAVLIATLTGAPALQHSDIEIV